MERFVSKHLVIDVFLVKKFKILVSVYKTINNVITILIKVNVTPKYAQIILKKENVPKNIVIFNNMYYFIFIKCIPKCEYIIEEEICQKNNKCDW